MNKGMENCMNVIEDECAEISVNTEEVEPRGTFAENERKKMTSFETLVHTALALEEDPFHEHSYAYMDTKIFKEGMDKDHCYYSHRKIQSLSDENLFVQPKKNKFDDKHYVLPHYRSNDSALDVTGFDTISDKCLSSENIHVKTVDVFTENCILPGVSDPDLSRMTIQTSFSLPNSPPSSKISVIDHSYSYIMSEQKLSEQNRMTLLKDHAYNNFSKIGCGKREVLLDHSYGNGKRRDSLPTNVGVKRGRSNDDLTLLGSYNFKRKDFTKSPFLDHSYQSVEFQNEQTEAIRCHSAKRNKSFLKESVVKTNKRMPEHGNVADSKVEDEITSNSKTYIVKQALLPNRLLMDHTYEEITDSTVDTPTGFVTKVQAVAEAELAQMFGEIKTDKSDHSYVIKNHRVTDIDLISEELSDSGTESLNEEEEEVKVNKQVPPYMDKEHNEHPYFKRMKNKS